MTIEYLQKLKDPRWQKKRLEILERDGWTCQKCFDSESTLAVHHRIYLANTAPWNYPAYLLITLCEKCHESNKSINESRICSNCFHFENSLCSCRELVDMRTGTGECADWSPRYELA